MKQDSALNPDRFARVMEVFTHARSLRGDARLAYVNRATASDPILRDEVEALLAHGDDDDSGILATSISGLALDEPDVPPDLNEVPQPSSTRSIGNFELLEKLGEGSMGTVFLSEQAAPIHRKVAIKVIRRGLESEEAVRRFEAEKQALALLNHPGIAQVYEAGRTTDGRSYFVMEYVSGETITTFCDHQQATIEERLRLFRHVCDAVQHAHYRGVIHRDLKPSNILISEIHRKPRPKVIDFGVAKAPRPTVVDSAQTDYGRIVGTLDYISPEQLERSSRVDIRADVFSLGAVLYELLVGEVPLGHDMDTPFDLFCRKLREDDPPRLSVRFRDLPPDRRVSLASRRGASEQAVLRALRGDLDHIVAKALDRDPTRRYASVQELSNDLGRHLSFLPVEARAPSASYRARKFARKNLGLVLAVSTIVAVSICAAIVSLGHRSDALSQLEETHWQSYVQHVANAGWKLEHGRASQAARQLEFADDEFRDWEWRHLKLKSDPSVNTLGFKDVAVRSMVKRADDSLIFFGLKDGSVQLRTYNGDHPIYKWQAHQDSVDELALSPDGSSLLSGSLDGYLRLWDTRTWEKLRELPISPKRVRALEFSKDGRLLALASWSREVLVLDAMTFEERLTHTFEETPPTDLAFSPDGRWLVVGTNAGVKLLEVESGEIQGLETAKSWYWTVAWSPNGRYIATGDSYGYVELWSVQTRTQVARIRSHGGWVTDVAFNADGSRLASTSKDRSVAVTDLKGSSFAPETSIVLLGHHGWVWGARFAPGEKELISFSEDGTVKTWDLRTGGASVAIRASPRAINALALSPRDGHLLAAGGDDGEVTLWDTRTASVVDRLPLQRTITDLVFHPDGRRVVGATKRPEVFIWDTARPRKHPILLDGHHTSPIEAIALSKDGNLVASAGWDSSVRLWDLEERKHLEGFVLGGDTRYWVRSVAFLSDTKVLSGHRDGYIRFWERGKREPTRELPAHEKGINALVFHPDEALMATASLDGTIKLWNTVTWKEQATLQDHEDVVRALAWSPDGKRLVSASRDHTLMLWSTARKDAVLTLYQHDDMLHDVVWGPDGRLISGAFDGTLRFWETDLAQARKVWGAATRETR